MEQQNQQPIQQEPNVNRDFQPPKKSPFANKQLYFFIALIAVVISVGGILPLQRTEQEPVTPQSQTQDTIPPQQTTQPTLTPDEPPTPLPTTTPTTFQNLLTKSCLNQKSNAWTSGEIDLDKLPIILNLNDLKVKKGNCDSFGGKRIDIYDNDLSVYISDKQSDFCCSGPSPLGQEGKQIYLKGDSSIYLRVSIKGPEPEPGYASIKIRGIKDLKLSNNEDIRVIIETTAIKVDNPELQRMEDKYMVVDTSDDLEAGAKYLTSEAEKKILEDQFFANFKNTDSFKKMESDLQGITEKSNFFDQTQAIDTSTWQTYRNERKEGDSYSLIAINLPSDWEINTSLPFQTYLQAHSPESEFRISLDIRNENEIIQGKNEITGDFYETTLLEAREKLWKKSYNSAFLESINMEVMQGEFTYVPESGWHYIFTDIRASPYIYMITLAEIDPQQDEVSDPTRLLNDQILSTFRFVEKVTQPYTTPHEPTYTLHSTINEFVCNVRDGEKDITDQANTVVLQSRQRIINLGVSEDYFDEHFELVCGKILRSGNTEITWRYTIGEFTVGIGDLVSQFPSLSLENSVGQLHEIQHVITQKEALSMMDWGI